ncbi:MAG: hypothetical protein LBR64_00700 [Dysgonamonadaceae bacterium]|nr:hypothetical protein [Dysgonamonadaceae bacterium]
MNFIKHFYAIITICFLFCNLDLKGQVTVGTLEDPVKGALMQFKTIDDAASDGDANAALGIGFPRVALVQLDRLQPMYSAAEAASLDEKTQRAHKGLVVYNITRDLDAGLTHGIYVWNGKKWVEMQKASTQAEYTIDCANVAVHGSYGAGQSLDNSNYLRIRLTVTEPGYYTINAISNPDNGYFFERTGSFYSTGTYSIIIYGMGKPEQCTGAYSICADPKREFDEFTLYANGEATNCTFEIPVRNTAIMPKFTMSCASVAINGQYFEDKPLDDSNTMTVEINVDPATFGAEAEIYTNEVDGISFNATFLLQSNPQTVTLAGTGIPRGIEDKVFTIMTNSESSTSSCEHALSIMIPQKRIMALGQADSDWGYNIGDAWKNPNRSSVNQMITNPYNFGPYQESIVKTEQINNVSTPASVGRNTSNYVTPTQADPGNDIIALTIANYQSMTPEKLGAYLFGRQGKPKIDIVALGHGFEFWRDGNADDAQKCDTLIKFMREGGILIVTSQNEGSNGRFFNRMFNTTNIGSALGNGAGSIYQFGWSSYNLPESMKSHFCEDSDPILQGPFGNIVSKTWGEDADVTRYVTNLPADEVVIYSSGRRSTDADSGIPENSATIFRHKELPFIFIGDGGFWTGNDRNNGDLANTPFKTENRLINGVTYTDYPTYKKYGTGGNYESHNATFLANALAWCLRQAELYRRSHKVE